MVTLARQNPDIVPFLEVNDADGASLPTNRLRHRHLRCFLGARWTRASARRAVHRQRWRVRANRRRRWASFIQARGDVLRRQRRANACSMRGRHRRSSRREIVVVIVIDDGDALALRTCAVNDELRKLDQLPICHAAVKRHFPIPAEGRLSVVIIMMEYNGCLRVLRWCSACGGARVVAWRTAELDDGEGLEDGTCETLGACLRETLVGPKGNSWSVTLWMADSTNGLEQQVSQGKG